MLFANIDINLSESASWLDMRSKRQVKTIAFEKKSIVLNFHNFLNFQGTIIPLRTTLKIQCHRRFYPITIFPISSEREVVSFLSFSWRPWCADASYLRLRQSTVKWTALCKLDVYLKKEFMKKGSLIKKLSPVEQQILTGGRGQQIIPLSSSPDRISNKYAGFGLRIHCTFDLYFETPI